MQTKLPKIGLSKGIAMLLTYNDTNAVAGITKHMYES